MGVLDYVRCRIRPFLWALWICVVLPVDVFAAAPLTFADTSVCPEEIIPTSTAILPLIGHDVSRLSLELEADEVLINGETYKPNELGFDKDDVKTEFVIFLLKL